MKLKHKVYAGAITVGGAAAGLPAVVGAQEAPADPTNGALTQGVADLGANIGTTYVPALFALATIGIGVKIGLKYYRKAGSNA